MKFSKLLIIAFFVLLPASCGKTDASKDSSSFTSEEYGFSFDFPGGWEEITKDLPNRWAILNGKNTILFTTNKATTQNLMALGKIQALRDLYPPASENKLSQEDLDRINEMVIIETFSGREWYTYGVRFSDKSIDSIISGTLCSGNEINLVLVSEYDAFESNKELYLAILNSFKCIQQ